MRRLAIAAIGLALVVGITVGGIVGNPFGGAAAARQQPTLSLSGVPVSVSAGTANFDVHTSVAGITNLGAYEWQLSFDPNVVAFVSATNGGFLGSTGRSVACPPPILPPSENLEPGNVRFGCVTGGLTPPGPNGGGLLSTVTFRPVGDGSPNIALVCAGLADVFGDDIPIGNVSACGPRITPTPGPIEPTSTPWPTVVPRPFGIIPAGASSAGAVDANVSETSHITVTLTSDPRRSICRFGRCSTFGAPPAVAWIEPRVGQGFTFYLTGPVGRDTTFTYRIETAGP